jgi:hypothetical protein
MVISFGFLSIDKILNEQIWTRFFQGFEHLNIQINVLIHSKESNFQFNHPFINVPTMPTSWEKLVDAEISLIQTSVDLNSDYFCLLSPNCLPLQTPEKFISIIKSLNGKSLMPNSEIWFSHFLHIDKKNYWGGHQWFVIHNGLGQTICNLKEQILSISKEIAWVDCEFAIQTCLFRNKLIDKQIINETSTFVDWNFPTRNGSSPKWLLRSFSFYDIKNLILSQDKNILFARKFHEFSHKKENIYYKIINKKYKITFVLNLLATSEYLLIKSMRKSNEIRCKIITIISKLRKFINSKDMN